MTRTERLVLRPWTRDAADLDVLFDMYSRPEVRRFIGTGEVMRDRGEALAMVERWSGYRGVLGVRALVTSEGEVLGSILLKPIPWSTDADERGTPEDIEIGWHLHPRAWGRGYATEGAAAVLAEAAAAGIERVVAVTHPDNAASQGVCRRLGMRPLGRTRRYYDTECELFEIAPSPARPVDSDPGHQPV